MSRGTCDMNLTVSLHVNRRPLRPRRTRDSPSRLPRSVPCTAPYHEAPATGLKGLRLSVEGSGLGLGNHQQAVGAVCGSCVGVGCRLQCRRFTSKGWQIARGQSERESLDLRLGEGEARRFRVQGFRETLLCLSFSGNHFQALGAGLRVWGIYQGGVGAREFGGFADRGSFRDPREADVVRQKHRAWSASACQEIVHLS